MLAFPGVVALPTVVSAQGQPPVVLEAPDACEASAAPARMVREDEALLPGRTARVVITDDARADGGGGLALEVVILEGGEPIHRRLLRSSECEALLDAASVIVTLGLTRVELPAPPPEAELPPPEADQPPPEADREDETDAQPTRATTAGRPVPPGAETPRADSPSPGQPSGARPQRAETAARLEPPALASAVREPSTSRAVASARPSSEAPSRDDAPSDSAPSPAPFVRGGIVSGVAPGVAAVADVGVALVWGTHRVELAGHYALPTSIGVGAGRIRVDWRAASLRACMSLSVAPLSVCAGLDVGALVGTGEDLDVNRTGTSLWLGGRVEGRARWTLGHGFGLGVDLAAIAPFQRPELDVDGVGVVHRTGALGVELAVAVEWAVGGR